MIIISLLDFFQFMNICNRFEIYNFEILFLLFLQHCHSFFLFISLSLDLFLQLFCDDDDYDYDYFKCAGYLCNKNIRVYAYIARKQITISHTYSNLDLHVQFACRHVIALSLCFHFSTKNAHKTACISKFVEPNYFFVCCAPYFCTPHACIHTHKRDCKLSLFRQV
jgi:hypothetical protein